MKFLKSLFSRMTFLIILITIEILVMLQIAAWIGQNAIWVYIVLSVIGVFIVLYLNMTSRHISFDMIWIIVIMVFPPAGALIYLLIGTNLFSTRRTRRLVEGEKEARSHLKQDSAVTDELYRKDPAMRGQFRYITEVSGFPFYRNTDYVYYPTGEAGFPDMLEEIKKAERFIFIEYFIIESGVMWDSILEVLEEKAAAGVDVRVLYDDVGSLRTLPLYYVKKLAEKGIKAHGFNRIGPFFAKIMDHRDHRKILVVDGRVAFSGGINLADEYINAKVRFGYWKDNVIRVGGEAVRSFTALFLSHWNAIDKDSEGYYEFLTPASGDMTAEPREADVDGYVAVYGETPLDDEITSQNIYMNILNQANDFCYIITPYLIIDSELQNALCLAAKRGVDVRLITPGIPDKKRVWRITRSYYNVLIASGVKIYEYQPGFIHSKVFVADDKLATVGTINLDYRSLYHHFEIGTYLYGSTQVAAVKKDFLETQEDSRLIKYGEIRLNVFSRLWLSILRVLAPLF